MNIERILDDRYILYLTKDETETLKILSGTFHEGNKSVTLKELISEGFEVSLSVKALLEDVSFRRTKQCPYCETHIENIDRLWKDRDDERKSDNDR